MNKLIVIKIEKRNEEAVELQKILTEFGCIIKTRLGLHEVTENSCSPEGLIILELCGSDSEQKKLFDSLSKFKTVKAKFIEI